MELGSGLRRPGLRLRLPATSANLGPGFDACGLAMGLWLTVEAHDADVWSVAATGKDAAQCDELDGHLIVDTCRDVWRGAGVPGRALALHLQNEIPLGAGCGSSAAALVAGVALAVHFGELPWTDEDIVAEACRREGHPDNVVPCWHGGFATSVMRADGQVLAAIFPARAEWPLLLAVQPSSLRTSVARALLPADYAKADAVHNVGRVALLVAAFAQGRREWLHEAMGDRLHQPYREAACPLLRPLMGLAGRPGFAGIALSGAGPSVLMIGAGDAYEAMEEDARTAVPAGTELLRLRISGGVEREVLG